MMEWISSPVVLWMVVAILLFTVEMMVTMSFDLLCLSIAAFATALLSAFDLGLAAQLIVFAICALLTFVFVRPVLSKHLKLRSDRLPKTNAEAIIGKQGRVVEPIGGRVTFGRIVIDGDNWQAYATDDTEIAVGETVEVVSRDSIILTVKSIDKP